MTAKLSVKSKKGSQSVHQNDINDQMICEIVFYSSPSHLSSRSPVGGQLSSSYEKFIFYSPSPAVVSSHHTDVRERVILSEKKNIIRLSFA